MGSVLLFGLVICLLAESVRGKPNQDEKKKYAKGKYSQIFEEITGVPEFCNKKACPKYTPVIIKNKTLLFLWVEGRISINFVC